MLNPLDQAQCQRHRHRVVQTRLGLQQRTQSPLEASRTKRRENGGSIGRSAHGADQDRRLQIDLEQHRGGQAGDHRCHGHPDGRQQQGRPRHVPHVPPFRRETALEQDQRQAQHSDGTGQLGVVERDAAGTVGAEQHSKTQEGHQQRHAEAGCGVGAGDRRQQEQTAEHQGRALDLLLLPCPRRRF